MSMQWFYNSKHWKNVRIQYIMRHPLCECCLKEFSREVHHKIHLTPENVKDDKIAFGADNLEALCTECHNNKHNRFVKSKAACDENITFDKNGNVVFKTIEIK